MTQSRFHEAKFVDKIRSMAFGKRQNVCFDICFVSFSREFFRRAANLATNEDLNKILASTFLTLGHMFFRMRNFQVCIFEFSIANERNRFVSSRKVSTCYNLRTQSVNRFLIVFHKSIHSAFFEVSLIRNENKRFIRNLVDLYHMCNDGRSVETNDRLIQLSENIQKDYQSAISTAEHRHLLMVR